MAAGDEGDESGGLNGLGSLVDDDHIKGARHARKEARAGEGERGAHNVRLLKDRQLDAVARRRIGCLPALRSQETNSHVSRDADAVTPDGHQDQQGSGDSLAATYLKEASLTRATLPLEQLMLKLSDVCKDSKQ